MKRSLNTLIKNTDVREFKVIDIEIQKISESKSQARTYFDPKKLEELSESIKKSGCVTTFNCPRYRKRKLPTYCWRKKAQSK
jgi:hypothetical protein